MAFSVNLGNPVTVYGKVYKVYKKKAFYHAQSLAATNCVTEQLSWLTVESFYVFFNKLDGQSY